MLRPWVVPNFGWFKWTVGTTAVVFKPQQLSSPGELGDDFLAQPEQMPPRNSARHLRISQNSHVFHLIGMIILDMKVKLNHPSRDLVPNCLFFRDVSTNGHVKAALKVSIFFGCEWCRALTQPSQILLLAREWLRYPFPPLKLRNGHVPQR